RRRHTRSKRDWSSDVCSSDLVIIPLVSYMFFKRENEGSGENTQVLPKWYTFIPLFVVGFLLLSLLRTVGDFTLTNSGEAFGFLEIGRASCRERVGCRVWTLV